MVQNDIEVEEDGKAAQEASDGTEFVPSRHGTYEERLRNVHFARWTNVAVSGSEAASAIASYLAHDHVLLRLFDAELFLKDIAHDYGDFCSSLLVNALLGWSLVSYLIHT
jgi:hypothetical protein